MNNACYSVLLRIFCLGLVLNFQTSSVFSQSITPVEFNAGGTELSTGNIILTASFGGIATTTFSKDTLFITQGYQQAEMLDIGTLPENEKVVITAFPNPCIRVTYLSAKNLENPTNCTITIYSSLGKVNRVIDNCQFTNEVPVKLRTALFDSGLYIIKITEKNTNKLIGIVKILKLTESK